MLCIIKVDTSNEMS